MSNKYLRVCFDRDENDTCCLCDSSPSLEECNYHVVIIKDEEEEGILNAVLFCEECYARTCSES